MFLSSPRNLQLQGTPLKSAQLTTAVEDQIVFRWIVRNIRLEKAQVLHIVTTTSTTMITTLQRVEEEFEQNRAPRFPPSWDSTERRLRRPNQENLKLFLCYMLVFFLHDLSPSLSFLMMVVFS